MIFLNIKNQIDGPQVAHNAGYDAYMTGVVFLKLKTRLKNIENY